MNDKYIMCSAIYYDDNKEHPHQPLNIKTGFVICGRRHHNCFATVAILSDINYELKKLHPIQGFLTNDDYFVDREEAFIIAKNANQIKPATRLVLFKNVNHLFSENIF